MSLGGKDSEIVRLSSEVQSLRNQLSEMETSLKNMLANLESDLNKERTLVKSLRQQVIF